MQRFQEIKEFFERNSQRRIGEINEVIVGLESKRTSKEIEISNLKKRVADNQNKIIKLTDAELDISFIQTLNEHHLMLQGMLSKATQELKDINSMIAQQQTLITQIKTSVMSESKLPQEISNEELSEIYHNFLSKIEYYPYNLMKGTYKIYYKTGQICYIIVNKVRNLQKAYLLRGESIINLSTGDITFENLYLPHSKLNDFSIPVSQRLTINIHDIFYSKYVETAAFLEIRIDATYRKKYLEQVHSKSNG